MAKILDSGRRQRFGSGAVRDNQVGKGRCDLLPARALLEVSVHFEDGARKYAPRNWERGIPLSRFVDSQLRHTLKLLAGRTDEDHARAMAWNALCFLDTRARIREGLLPAALDDLPKPAARRRARRRA